MKGGIWCALRCEVRCGQKKMCLTVRGVSVPQRLHDRDKRWERRWECVRRVFADDLSIHMIRNNQLRAHRLLQNTIKAILLWLAQFGFPITPPKSKLIIFEKRKPKTPFLSLLLGSQSTHPPLQFLIPTYQKDKSWKPPCPKCAQIPHTPRYRLQ